MENFRRIEPKMFTREVQDFFEAYSNFQMFCVEAEKKEIFGGDDSKSWDSPEKKEVAFFVKAADLNKDQEKEFIRWYGLMNENLSKTLSTWGKEGWKVQTEEIKKGELKKFFSCRECGGEREVVENRERTSCWWECPSCRERR